jgi:LmbE family N-acetylglucosaminyl deacetylase
MYGRRIVLLAPHPDDEIVGCAAAISRARSRGGSVAVAYLSDGIPGADLLWPWQRRSRARRSARRWAEAQACADLVGCEILVRNLIPSRTVRQHLPGLAALLRGMVERHAPDVIWVPAYEGGHQDHDATHFLASRLARGAPVWEFSEYNYAGGHVRSQAFPQMRGDEIVLRLTESEARLKRRLLDLYASERGNLRHIELTQECFRPFVAANYAQPPHAGPLFYQRFQWVPYHPRVDHTRPLAVCGSIARAASTLEAERGRAAGDSG